MRRVSFVGLGPVGICTAVHFAQEGCKVIASSKDKKKVELISKGISPFFEPDLQEKLKMTIQTGMLEAVLGRESAVLDTDMTFITVGTPSLPDGSVDLRIVTEAAGEIGKVLEGKTGYHLVVVRSTVPPGTTENLVRPILEKYSRRRAGNDFGLAMSPEFLREGAAMYDVAHPDRVVIGEFDTRSGDLLEELNEELYGEKVPILRMNLSSAELAKYASNAFLATKISFINQIANVCERIPGVDVADIANAMGLDPRIGPGFLKAGAGWGGSCFPKDTKGVVALSRELGYDLSLVTEVVSANEAQAKHMVELAKEELGSLKGKRIAVLGLSFKPDTDDVREAPSLRIVETLLKEGASVVAFDPVAIENAKRVLGGRVAFAESSSECLKGADGCMLVTEWSEFKKLGPDDFVRLMRTPALIDGRRIYDPEMFSKKLRFRAVGYRRPEAKP